MKKLVFDLEQFLNFHSVVFYDIDTKEKDVFVIHTSRDEREKYFQYLIDCKSNTGLIGFNNIGYDYPLIHFILKNMKKLLSVPVLEALKMLYDEGQRIINEKFTTIPEWKTEIKQLDLFRIHHFNNKAKIGLVEPLKCPPDPDIKMVVTENKDGSKIINYIKSNNYEQI